MSEQQSPADLHQHYFISLVTMLSMSVMQQLGKIRNPATGKIEVSLEAAQATIDMLDMLEAKTRGNLDTDEEKLLRDTLSALKLNYVETAQTEKAKPTDGKPRETPTGRKDTPQEESAGEERIKAADSCGERKDPKFHKRYSDNSGHQE